MSIRTVIQAASVAAVAVVFTSAAAIAFSPFNISVVKNANVYANRTMQSSVVNKVKVGQTVKVMQILPHWCYIQAPGPDGWVKCNVLAPFY